MGLGGDGGRGMELDQVEEGGGTMRMVRIGMVSLLFREQIKVGRRSSGSSRRALGAGKR